MQALISHLKSTAPQTGPCATSNDNASGALLSQRDKHLLHGLEIFESNLAAVALVCLSATRSLAFVSIATCDALAPAKRKTDQWLSGS